MFALCNEPIDYQLTVHFNNYENTFGRGTFIMTLEWCKSNTNQEFAARAEPLLFSLIAHYGVARIELFLKDVIFQDVRSVS